MTRPLDDGRPVGLCLAGLLGVTGLAALVVASTPQLRAEVIRRLALSFEPQPGSMRELADILIANGRVVGAILLLAAAARRRALPLLTARVLAAGLVALNATIVGAALGAYGLTTMTPWLVHLPLEWAALGIAASTLAATPVSHLRASLAVALILVVAAAIETFATPMAS